MKAKSMENLDIEFMDRYIWSYIIHSLQNNKDNKHGYWTDGEEILCKTETEADVVADFLEDLGFDCLNTGYYNPEEDERDDCVDEHTGYWYINNN